MKKLLYFASDYRIGLSSLLTDQLISISESGVDVYAVAGENEQEIGLSQLLRHKNINVRRISGLDTHSDFNRLVLEIYHIVIENNIDIIHVQNNWQLAIVGSVKFKLLFKRKIKIVYTLHGFRNNSPIKSRMAQIIIGSSLLVLADHVICMTEYLRKKFILLSYKINLIPLGVKGDFFTEDFVVPPVDALHLVFPAQFRAGKNQNMIVCAFARYVKTSGDTDSTLTLPGDGKMRADIKELVKKLGISRQVILPGKVSKDEIKRMYLESNIAIVASNSETFGQSIVEPFVIGRCVVSTPVGIAPEIITNGLNGFIFNSEDDLFNVLSQIGQNKSSLMVIGKANYSKRYLFSWSNITNMYIDKLKLK